mgnify:FL=1
MIQTINNWHFAHGGDMDFVSLSWGRCHSLMCQCAYMIDIISR